ncbi:MAG: hydroxymethylbilane synthase, partial [Selenomonas sp.]|nr:hydroxymethylbilane synthase [Selenomonas sp.]
DAVVSLKYGHFADLPEGAKVGTSSLRRKAQLLHARPDLNIQDLRGNVNTRLRKLEEENFDAIVLAVAGLTRLGFKDRIAEVMPRDIMLPAVGQGALAIEARGDDAEILEMLAFLNDEDMAACAKGERAFLAKVEGGCQVPVGVYGSVEQDELQLEAVIASLDGARLYRDKIIGAKAEAEKLGGELAEKLLAAGGLEIMQELGLLLDK